MPSSRDLLLTALHERISWFRLAPRQADGPDNLQAETPRPRPRLHTLAHFTLFNRDHEVILLRPTMWLLFDV